eukprot:570570-Amorphochlora_amoeboformis.AAC.2
MTARFLSLAWSRESILPTSMPCSWKRAISSEAPRDASGSEKFLTGRKTNIRACARHKGNYERFGLWFVVCDLWPGVGDK